jgi:hypothetical protein
MICSFAFINIVTLQMNRQDLELGLLLGLSGANLALFTVTDAWRKHLESVTTAKTFLGKLAVLRDRGSLRLLGRATLRRSGMCFAVGAVIGLTLRPIFYPIFGNKEGKAADKTV